MSKIKWYTEAGLPVYSYKKEPPDFRSWLGYIIAVVIATVVLGLILAAKAHAGEVWKVTSYCACQHCCGPNAKGVTASGKQVKEGMVACNWLPFGTQVKVEGLGTFTVEDRGARSLFGSKTNHIKHLDVYMPTHQAARQFGVKYLEVQIQ
jgi:3D (Asp-Asp-Asp) domain-containing protein